MSSSNYYQKSLLALSITAFVSFAHAQDEDAVELETFIAEEEVQDDLGLLPTEPVESVFGFGKNLLETPRAVSSISSNMIEALNLSDIDDLVVVSPGAFTQSFFGVAGSLDVRGTAGEVYFRGMRRLDNPGNYPTPLGASDRIDIVRGPATPIMGPAKIGGYLNFVPKSSRAETGQYLEDATGRMKINRGSWDKNIVSAEVGGPMSMGDKSMGYYLYAETENSGSYYENSATDQNIYQASFNMDLSASTRFEFGGMYHEFDGNQVAGWNRLTQDLIDNGTYITGSPTSLDTDGDGRISHAEYDAGDIDQFFFLPDFEAITDDDLKPNQMLTSTGETQLKHYNVLVAPEDLLQNEATTLYFDIFHDLGSGWSLTNKLFYDAYKNLNENAYGFSQFHDSSVIEERLILEYAFEGALSGGIQFSPSIRHTEFEHGDDYIHEYFDRRDLTGPSTALDKRVLATTIDAEYSEYYVGDYTDYGFGVMADLEFGYGLSAILGARYDSVSMNSMTPDDKLLYPEGEDAYAEDTQSGTSWTASFSWASPWGITPYATASSQLTMIAGQGAELTVGNILDEAAMDDSNLLEGGIKGSFLDGRLYAALAYFEQDRTDYNAQSATTNESVETTGTELEVRYVITDDLTFTAAATQIEIVNLNTQEEGSRFTFLGAEDLPNVSPGAFYGGVVNGVVAGPAEKAGIPKNSYSMTLFYSFLENYSVNFSYFHADDTPSGYTGSVTLPSYDLFNMGLGYTTDTWDFSLNLKNITSEKYYRSNFPNLFGTSVVLPEKPFNWEASIAYKF